MLLRASPEGVFRLTCGSPRSTTRDGPPAIAGQTSRQDNVTIRIKLASVLLFWSRRATPVNRLLHRHRSQVAGGIVCIGHYVSVLVRRLGQAIQRVILV